VRQIHHVAACRTARNRHIQIGVCKGGGESLSDFRMVPPPLTALARTARLSLLKVIWSTRSKSLGMEILWQRGIRGKDDEIISRI